MHPSMKHLSMLRAGLPPFFLIFFLLICLLKGKITCLGFSSVVAGLLSLGTSPHLLDTLLHFCHVFCYEQIAQIVKSIHRLLAKGCIVLTT